MKKCAFLTDEFNARGRKVRNACTALDVCECDNCSFRKTEEEAADGRRLAAMRIMLLDREQRRRIIDKYYRLRERRVRNEKNRE
ncbi:MAG: hypothetical protein J5940_00240 [Clostridia bacterium]|nr:hypothetical protein [Clostridia bacterium]